MWTMCVSTKCHENETTQEVNTLNFDLVLSEDLPETWRSPNQKYHKRENKNFGIAINTRESCICIHTRLFFWWRREWLS